MWSKTRDTLKYLSVIAKGRERKSTKPKTTPPVKEMVDVYTQKERKEPKNVSYIPRKSATRTKSKGNTVHKKLRTAEEIKLAALNIGYVGPICSYCQNVSQIKTAKEHTGKEAEYCYWVCASCENVSVTTRKGSYEESGDLADALTRRYRGEVQKLLSDKKKKLSYDAYALSEWIQQTIDVPSDKAWVGRLSKEQLAMVALQSQREVFDEKYGFIFQKVEEPK